MSQIAKTAQVHKVALGTFADDPKTAVRWAEAGAELIAVSTDVGLIYEKAKQTVHDLRGAV